jgi:excisionase family DNA binding protein
MARPRRRSPMMTTGDVARFLNVHINTVRRWSDHGVIRAYRIGPRGDRRFRRRDITGFVFDRKEATDEPTHAHSRS